MLMIPSYLSLGSAGPQAWIQDKIILTAFLNEGQRCKLLESPRAGFPSIKVFLIFNSLKSPFLGFRVIQTQY